MIYLFWLEEMAIGVGVIRIQAQKYCFDWISKYTSLLYSIDDHLTFPDSFTNKRLKIFFSQTAVNLNYTKPFSFYFERSRLDMNYEYEAKHLHVYYLYSKFRNL